MDTTATETPLRSHDAQKTCSHSFVTSYRCVQCGWVPPPGDALGQLLTLWWRLTHEEQLAFLKRVTIR